VRDCFWFHEVVHSLRKSCMMKTFCVNAYGEISIV
jgi:hypothetical protein